MSSRKRSLSPHQKQMRFLTCLFGALMVLSAVGLIWLISTLNPTGHLH